MAGTQTKLILIVGKSGNGKSYLTNEIIENYAYDSVFIIDPNDEYNFRNAKESESIATYFNFLSVSKFVNKDNIFIYKDNEHFFFDVFYDYFKSIKNSKWGQKRKLLVVDEAHEFTSFTGGRGSQNSLDQITRKRRHLNFDIILIAHRLSDFPVHIRGNSTSIISFALTEKIDYKNINDFIDDVELVRNLGVGEKIILKNDRLKGGKILRKNVGGKKINKIIF